MIALLIPALLGAALLVAVIAAGRWFVAADPARLARIARGGGSLLMVLVGVLLVLRGQPQIGLSLAAAGLGRHAARRRAGFGTARSNPGGAGRSSVRTALLDATLDHATGEIDAVVRAGRFGGRQLSGMDRAEALGLWVDCGRDEDSRSVVEAYLDRRHPEWRQDVERDGDAGSSGADGPRGAHRSGPMTQEHAYEMLGLPTGAAEAEIRKAHRRLMKEVHPDQGGDAARAAAVNEARDVLLAGRRR